MLVSAVVYAGRSSIREHEAPGAKVEGGVTEEHSREANKWTGWDPANE
jgi:hypothetical protein